MRRRAFARPILLLAVASGAMLVTLAGAARSVLRESRPHAGKCPLCRTSLGQCADSRGFEERVPAPPVEGPWTKLTH